MKSCAIKTDVRSSRRQHPHPYPPQGEGVVFAASEPWSNDAAWAPARGRSAPLAGVTIRFPFSWTTTYPRTRRHLAAEIRGPCRAGSRNPAAADGPTTGHKPGGHTGPPLQRTTNHATTAHNPYGVPCDPSPRGGILSRKYVQARTNVHPNRAGPGGKGYAVGDPEALKEAACRARGRPALVRAGRVLL